MASEFLLTSESVGEGHPDKVADRISDAVLDAYLARDPHSRVACETLVTQDYICVAGEVRSTAVIAPEEIERIARQAVADIGYTDAANRFSADTAEVHVRLHAQSVEIAAAVDKGDRRTQGAGDQGMMFGYATRETEQLMPAPITWAHALTRKLAEYRKSGKAPWLRPDSKSQVSVRYLDGKPIEITRIVVSTQHSADISLAGIREFVIEELVPDAIRGATLGHDWRDHILVNPSGSFVHGGPATDTGLTGRKIIVDTYGGAARHGGGAFSGKDPSKVDRSAAYATRWAAKNVVASGRAERCEICIAYAIGVAQPVAIGVETFGTGDAHEIARWIKSTFDLTPFGIVEELQLARPIYAPTAAYGHFGRAADDGLFPWENVARAAAHVTALA
ncbi:MAG TPA: methionine adenosyltransferase [Longimicrobiales bacterium]|nr:methionine adenosyltransferase [Longimicrobiales bacterium]